MNTLTAIATRRTTRDFKPDQISDKDLKIILSAGSSAPVALGDYSYVHFTVVQNRDVLRRTAGNFPDPIFYGAPTVVVISAKPYTYEGSDLIACFNTGCIIENMYLAATELSLGCVFISNTFEESQEDAITLGEFGLPEGFMPIASVALGYPVEPIVEKNEFKNEVSILRI